MKKRWYVIDAQENTTTWNSEKERADFFNSRAAAVKRAISMADDEPHKAFFVCETVDCLVVETKPVKRIAVV